jgi:hypothetical protein
VAFRILYYDLDARQDVVETFDRPDWVEARTRFNLLESLRRAGERIMDLQFDGVMPPEQM